MGGVRPPWLRARRERASGTERQGLVGKVDRGTEALTCRELVELVTEYLEGALSPEGRARFDEHVADCVDCRAHLDQMRRTLGLVGRLTEGSVSPQAQETLLETFRDWRE